MSIKRIMGMFVDKAQKLVKGTRFETTARRVRKAPPYFYDVFKRQLIRIVWKSQGILSRQDTAQRQPISDVRWMNKTLKSQDECKKADRYVRDLGLPSHDDWRKHWDSLSAYKFIVQSTDQCSSILDLGGETYSTLLDWLYIYGYRSLYMINPDFPFSIGVGPIKYSRGDGTRTPYSNEQFDVVTCLSVIEHGVNKEALFREMDRIVKPGGFMIISTDYWEPKIYAENKVAYGEDVHIFSKNDITSILKVAEAYGFYPLGDIDYKCHEKVIYWDKANANYTFIVFALKKHT